MTINEFLFIHTICYLRLFIDTVSKTPMAQLVKNKRSTTLNGGKAVAPSTQDLDYGELAINYADGQETIFIKNNSDEIAAFSSDSVIDTKYISTSNTVTAITSASTDTQIGTAKAVYDLIGDIDAVLNAILSGTTE